MNQTIEDYTTNDLANVIRARFPNETHPLTDRYARTVPAFRAKIGLIAEIANMTPLDVYSLWLEYSRKCSDYDQSALIGEFVDWHCDELGGDAESLRDALGGGTP